MTLFDLTGRRAPITGSSQGIGFALARALGSAGAAVILNGRDGNKQEVAAAAETTISYRLPVATSLGQPTPGIASPFSSRSTLR